MPTPFDGPPAPESFFDIQFPGPLNPDKLSPGLRRALADTVTVQHVPKRDHLFRPGEGTDTFFYVQKGILRLYFEHDGVDETHAFSEEKYVVSETSSVWGGPPRPVGLEALEDSVVLGFTRDDFLALQADFPEAETIARQVMTWLVLQLDERIRWLRVLDARARYLHLLERRPQLLDRAPLMHIASYLGMTPYTLSRIRAEL